MNVTVKKVSVAVLSGEEFRSLFDRYADESGLVAYGKWAIAWDVYKSLEASGVFTAFVAYDGEKPVGLTGCLFTKHLHYSTPALCVDGLFVLPEYRKQGVGGRLFGCIHRLAKELQVKHLWVNCPPDGALDKELSRKSTFKLIAKTYENGLCYGG